MKVSYETVMDVLWYGYDYPPAVTMKDRVMPVFETAASRLGTSAKRVLIALLGCYERGRERQRGRQDLVVRVAQSQLLRMSGLEATTAERAVAELIDSGLVGLDGTTWTIKHGKRLYQVERVPILPQVRARVLASGKCAHCGTPDNLEVDHITPWSLGGSDDETNLQALCESCNRKKLNKFIG